jgi:hypothetical protein
MTTDKIRFSLAKPGVMAVSKIEEIKDQVEKNGNLLTVTMEQLKEAHGAGKLGIHVRDEISQLLVGMGLGHVPQVLPNSQRELVRLYKHGTPVGQLIDAVLSPGEQHDRTLIERFNTQGPDYAAIVQKIRELVAD